MLHEQRESPIIRLFHVTKRYGSQAALLDVTVDIGRNEFVFLTGPSGAGKSTLLKLLYLADFASEGQILIEGINLQRIPRRRIPLLRRGIGVVFQDFKLIPTRTVYDNVALVLEAAGKDRKFIGKKVRHLMRSVGLENKMEALPPSLSGGEQQRVAVARAICGDPNIVLADEPTGSLDQESADIIMDLLHGFHANGATVILATHDAQLIESSRKRTISLKNGHVVSDREYLAA
ncbi:MAG: cell division ATP-binding protein FtsE [Desulfatibacillaceae bacterium]